MTMDFLLSAAFVLCWSSGFVGAKLGAQDAGAVTILMWRFLPLAVVLAAVAARRGWWRTLTPRTVGRQAVIGLLSRAATCSPSTTPSSSASPAARPT